MNVKMYEYLVAFKFNQEGCLTPSEGTTNYITPKKINNWEEIITAQEVITCSLKSEGIKASNLNIYNFIYLGRVNKKNRCTSQ